jgi:diguanylate cyclase (GGDEF)-like protein
MLATTAGEKAALVKTELERARALALVTARIPPFSELYADKGSLAARIASVAGPRREIDNALVYDWQLYPDRFVEAGYIDAHGRENARVVRGRPTAATSLERDVRRWPSFVQGLSTPIGRARISRPFISPTAHVEVVAATTPVEVDGRVRAYVELELATAAIRRVLAAETEQRLGLAIVVGRGAVLASAGRQTPVLPARLRPGFASQGGMRLAVRTVPEASVAGGPWFLVASAHSPSALAIAFAPTQAAVLALALLLLAASAAGFWRSRRSAAERLAAEQRARAQAEQIARIDPLTGISNRRDAMETLDRELARGSRHETPVGVLIFDIDRFKRINDDHGHAGGDIVLVEIATRLRAETRQWDTAARIGGEEFCVIAPNMESEDALAELGERLRLAISRRPIELANGVALPVTVSGGAALLAGDEESADYALECADRALGAAKRRGRNRLLRFSHLEAGDLRAEQPQCLHLAEAIALAGDLREGAPALHSCEVAELAAEIGRRLGLSEDALLRVRLGGWLHDVGKIAIPDSILTKRGPLSADEWEIIKTHPAAGDALLRNFPELAPACAAVRHHHERHDGSGYPDRLSGTDIPLEARIIAVADAYSAMTSPRPYQEARSRTDAIDELRRCAGSQFDPAIVEALADELSAAPTPAELSTTRRDSVSATPSRVPKHPVPIADRLHPAAYHP